MWVITCCQPSRDARRASASPSESSSAPAGGRRTRRHARRDEKAPTLATSNRPFEDWARLLLYTVVVTPLLDRLLHRGHGASLLQSEEQHCPYSFIWVDCIT